MSFIRIIKNLIICWIKIPLILYKKDFVFADRYIYGYVLEPLSVKYYGSKKMALKLISLFPKPELIIYLEISKEKSIERKNDLTHDQLKTLEKSFNELSLNLKIL